MSIVSRVASNNKDIVITISERFDFSQYKIFREAYCDCNGSGTDFYVDLSKANYMDSSALGMLLLLKEHADKLAGKVIIERPNDAINKVLEIAQFHHLMTIVR
ncbi:STAS domain-containing protein [Psychrobium sp. 1_MG-2023]|uniref:STAS domain-containing protein n=1 Tax=Psychrobium sp. 1_MG-2023 TaxID=3062624 RepID=UPI000C340659|nr:STAS domain-containing protein [Psychrobium sp. 1_MG-2023]MDP2560154.1 STAS domain-containing protein [Psychrobium sp. 1_MG-2023]PKF56967.1 anti-anti-sigma factor [Alteromonadales bacterium alter-6D02]